MGAHYAQTLPVVPKSQGKNLLWVAREETGTRRLAGEPALLSRMKAHWRKLGGSSFTVFGDKKKFPPLLEVRRLFIEAAVISGVHGAGFANIMFCSPGTHIVQITCKQRRCHDYAHVSAAIGLKYWYVPLQRRESHL